MRIDKKCSLPVDFLFEAENGTHFGAHRRNLELYSGAFQPLVDVAPVDFESGFQVMRVTERRGVVSLMLRYMHNHWQPMIDKLGFDVLKDLAEAVEKYEIYSAIEVCRFRMRYVFPFIMPGDFTQNPGRRPHRIRYKFSNTR